MFRRLSEPLLLSEASMLALRPALNAPVLNVEFLPVGPARAAIVVFAEEWGGIGVAIGIRSNEGGQIAVLRNQESIEPDVTIGAALEPALADAERMGFLFDEDMVESSAEGQGRGHATALWGRLMGDIDMPPAPRAVPDEPAATDSKMDLVVDPDAGPGESLAVVDAVPELVLDDLARTAAPEVPLDVTQDISAFEVEPKPAGRMAEATTPLVDATARPAPELSQETQPLDLDEPDIASESALPRQAPVQPPLSKFRHLPKAAEAPSAEQKDGSNNLDQASQLGRIPLVRVRRGRDGKRRVPYLARLLSSF